jgi:type VI protein secretion system component VasA
MRPMARRQRSPSERNSAEDSLLSNCAIHDASDRNNPPANAADAQANSRAGASTFNLWLETTPLDALDRCSLPLLDGSLDGSATDSHLLRA